MRILLGILPYFVVPALIIAAIYAIVLLERAGIEVSRWAFLGILPVLAGAFVWWHVADRVIDGAVYSTTAALRPNGSFRIHVADSRVADELEALNPGLARSK
jgi:hypothetical protein